MTATVERSAQPPEPTRPSPMQLTWVAYAEMVVLHGLDKANHRLLRRHGRAVRHHTNRLREIDPLIWHTIIPTTNIDVDELLDGVLKFFDQTAVVTDAEIARCVRAAISTYLRTVVAAGMEHNRDALAQMLRGAGCLEDSPAA